MKAGIALGIDGGASNLKWSVRNMNGQILHGSTPGANLQMLGWERYLEQLGHALSTAVEAAQAALDEVQSVGLGLSGVDRPAEKERLKVWVRTLFPELTGCWIGNDALPALRQGAGALAGVILIAGTGSICVGALPDGRTLRVGGWGSRLGDEGSGFWIGQRALAEACRMADGRQKATPLLPALLHTLNLPDPIALIPWTAAYDDAIFKRQVASLTPLVFDLANQNDPAASRIVRQAHSQLAAQVMTAVQRLDQLEADHETSPGTSPWTVVCAGGLFEQNQNFYQTLADRLHRRAARLCLTRLVQPPSLGALALGEEQTIR